MKTKLVAPPPEHFQRQFQMSSLISRQTAFPISYSFLLQPTAESCLKLTEVNLYDKYNVPVIAKGLSRKNSKALLQFKTKALQKSPK
jgi:hypothetical protein